MRPLKGLLIGNGRGRSVDLGQTNCELFVVGQCPILKNTDRQRLAQFYGRVGVAAPVDPGVNAVAKGDVVSELVQLAVDSDLSRVSTRIRKE